MSEEPRTPPRLVVVAGSWGALDAACDLLHALPADFGIPLLLVLHRSRHSQADRLRAAVQRCSGQDLREVEDKEPLRPGAVLLAPPDYHVLVEEGSVELSLEAPVAYSRPSIDLAMESAADAYAGSLVAVLLSGTGSDGTAGIRHVRRRGGRAFVQDPRTAEKAQMPQSAIDATPVDLVAPADELGRSLALLDTAGRR